MKCKRGKREGSLLQMDCNDKFYEKEKGESIFDGTISRLGSEFFHGCDVGMTGIIAQNETGCTVLNGF